MNAKGLGRMTAIPRVRLERRFNGWLEAVVNFGHIQSAPTDECVLASCIYGYGTQDPL
jgi:hypothetical protein